MDWRLSEDILGGRVDSWMDSQGVVYCGRTGLDCIKDRTELGGTGMGRERKARQEGPMDGWTALG